MKTNLRRKPENKIVLFSKDMMKLMTDYSNIKLKTEDSGTMSSNCWMKISAHTETIWTNINLSEMKQN